MSNLFDTLFYEMQLPIIIALLYFLFQLPAVKKYSKDQEQNLKNNRQRKNSKMK